MLRLALQGGRSRCFTAKDICEAIMNRPTLRATRRPALLMLFGWTAASNIADPAHAAGPVCLYQSRTYSEGALLRVRKTTASAIRNRSCR